MFASLTLSEDVESHSMQPPASDDRRLCLGIIRGGEDTRGVRGELPWPDVPRRGELTWLRCRERMGSVGDLRGLETRLERRS